MKTRVQFVLFAGSCVCSDSRYRWYLVSVCVCVIQPMRMSTNVCDLVSLHRCCVLIGRRLV